MYMAQPKVSPLLLQFVDDELLRAPLLYDQLLEAVIDGGRRSMSGLSSMQRTAQADLIQAVRAQTVRMGDYFMRSLRDQVQAELSSQKPPAEAKPRKPKTWSLVDEDEVTVDVELSHTVEAIKSVAEYELRELRTYTAALVGDFEMAKDHNPFRADTMARAVWASAQALPLSRGHQVAFMRQASEPLAALLRTSYAASTSRLESMGVEPASYRTLILPSGSRGGGRSAETTFTPDLYRMSESMQAPRDGQSGLNVQGTSSRGNPRPEPWTDVARDALQPADRQAVELVSRLFESMMGDTRVPDDVSMLIGRLHGPAMRLALRDRSLLDHVKHPLWRFINEMAFAAEMSPDLGDPERIQFLKHVLATIDQLASEPVQNTSLYRRAYERLEEFLGRRLTRRLAAVATQIGSLQNLEERFSLDGSVPTTMSGPLDVHQLDTVPAQLMSSDRPEVAGNPEAPAWLRELQPGDWVRMFFKGRWVKAQMLWHGEQREFLLFGDGASDDTWAVRAGALLMMYSNGLVKTMKKRSIIGSAASRVQDQISASLDAS